MPHKIRVLAVVGPTAGGKSDLAMALAQHLPIEIVCMDSMQIYQGMDIGTAKPTPEDRARVAHHMLDVCTPHQAYSVAEYVEAADAAIAGIASRGHVPVLVGGTGLYLRALRYPMTLGGGARDDAVRARYQQMLEKEGAQAVHALLHQRDPEAARTLHPNNTRRVIRALEENQVRYPRRGFVELLIHEQYFYEDYAAYLPDYRERVLAGVEWCVRHGYHPDAMRETLLN